VASNDTFVLVDVSDPTTPNKKIQQQNILAAGGLLPDGSAGTPALRFSSDTNVGLFRPTTDTLAFATGGSERLRIDSSGRVGIGTSSPATTLDCKGSITLGAQNSATVYLQPTSGSGTNVNGQNLILAGGIPTGSGTSGQVQIVPSTSSATGGTGLSGTGFKGLYIKQQITSWDSNPGLYRLNAVFGNSASEGNRSGFVGDGVTVTIDGTTDTASSAIELVGRNNGADGDQGIFRFFGNSNKVPYATLVATTPGVDYSSGNFQIRTYNAGVQGTVATFTNTGRLGIGTTSPGHLFTVLAPAGAQNILLAGQAGVSNGYQITSDGTNLTHQWYNNSGEAMRIDSSGSVYIGLTSATIASNGFTLRKNSYFHATNTDQECILVNRLGTDGSIVNIRKAGSTVGSISVTTSATAYNTSSDYRLKENVVPLTGAADRLNQLQVHRFNFIADPDTTVDGFIAHEAQAVVPECVTGAKDEVDDDGNPVYQGIDQSKLVPLLTAALQEALAKIEVLEQRLTDAGIA